MQLPCLLSNAAENMQATAVFTLLSCTSCSSYSLYASSPTSMLWIFKFSVLIHCFIRKGILKAGREKRNLVRSHVVVVCVKQIVKLTQCTALSTVHFKKRNHTASWHIHWTSWNLPTSYETLVLLRTRMGKWHYAWDSLCQIPSCSFCVCPWPKPPFDQHR